MKKIKKMKERILSLALTFFMVVSLVAGMEPVKVNAANVGDVVYQFNNAYDCQRSPAFPQKDSTIKLSGFASPYGVGVVSGNWEIKYLGKYDQGTHSSKVRNLISELSYYYGNYGTDVYNTIDVYALFKDGNQVCDGVVAGTIGEGILFCGTILSGSGAGYYLTNAALNSGSIVEDIVTGDLLNPTMPDVPTESFSATLTYEVVGGSGTKAPVAFTAQETVTLPDPNTIFTPASNREFFGWMVHGEDGDVKVSAYNNAQFTVENGESYTATAYYGYRVNVVNLPEGASVISGSTEFVGNPNIVVVPEFQGQGGLEEGNLFAIMSNSMTSAPTLDVVNATAVSVGSGDGQYVYILQDITGPVTVTFAAHTHSLTEVPAVPATCTTEGNNKYYTCDCGKVFKADGTTETSVEAETIPAGHVWSTEKDERGHWNVCSACGTTDVDIEELGQVPHMDADLNNKCDVCDYVVYHVTLNANGLTVGGASVRDTDGYRVSRFSDGETFLVPELCTVEVICYTEINDAIAPGASVEFVAGEGIANTGCKVYNFTRDTAIVLNPNPGEVEVEETVNPEAPIQGVEIKNEIDEIIETSKIFTTVEIGRILAGEDARVWLDVNKIDTVPTVEAEAIEDKVAELGANAEITYFDASFFKQVGNDTAQTVSEPGMDIEITIAIPEDLLNSDTTKTRTYQLLRYHDVAEGEDVTVINGAFSNGEFTFKTDKFSTYAIIYTDRAVNPGVTPPPSGTNTPNTNAGNNVKDEVPNTGDNNVLSYSFILMVLSAVAFFFSTQKKKSYK